jgi:hypothetical protein
MRVKLDCVAATVDECGRTALVACSIAAGLRLSPCLAAAGFQEMSPALALDVASKGDALTGIKRAEGATFTITSVTDSPLESSRDQPLENCEHAAPRRSFVSRCASNWCSSKASNRLAAFAKICSTRRGRTRNHSIKPGYPPPDPRVPERGRTHRPVDNRESRRTDGRRRSTVENQVLPIVNGFLGPHRGSDSDPQVPRGVEGCCCLPLPTARLLK